MMNKKPFVIVMVVLLVLTFSSCSAVRKKEESISVEANGVKRTVALKNGEAPIADVIEACGISLDWTSSSTAIFKHKGVNYVLDVPNKTLHKEGSSFNYIQVPPGTDDGYIHSADGNIFVDFSTMKSVLYMLEIDAILTRN